MTGRSLTGPKEKPGVTRRRIGKRLRAGRSHAEIARELRLSKSTVSYHARKLGHPAAGEFAARYDWLAIQRYYDAGHSRAECCAHFGLHRSTLAAAVSDGRLIPRPRKAPLCELLVSGRRTSRHGLKLRLIEAGIKAHRCDECGIEGWLGKPLSLQLHHLNGQGDDNRLTNLRLLCPNCHSQTENFGGRALARCRTAGPTA